MGVAQSVRAPDCGSGGHRFESDLPPHKITLIYFGMSPSGKATDFDSVIPMVRIHPSQP